MPDVIIPGPSGRLEARYKHSGETAAPLALILHHHPQHGGTMNHKLIYHLFHTFADRGFSTLRFNFRGVGKSQGNFDDGEGELADATSALDWAQSHNPHSSECWVVGASFGAWIGMQLLMRRPEVTSFISVSPPANIYDFSFLAPCPSSGLMIQGDRDDIVPAESVRKLAEKLSAQRGIEIAFHLIPGATHFFYESLGEVRRVVTAYLDQHRRG